MAKKPNFNLDEIKQSVAYSRIAAIGAIFVLGGAIFYHLVEKFSWLNSFYFTVITLATVGYGDFVPKTAAGKIFTMVYVFVGISVFLVLARVVLGGVVARGYQRRQHQNHK